MFTVKTRLNHKDEQREENTCLAYNRTNLAFKGLVHFPHKVLRDLLKDHENVFISLKIRKTHQRSQVHLQFTVVEYNFVMFGGSAQSLILEITPSGDA